MRKKILAIVLALVLVAAMLPTVALAAGNGHASNQYDNGTTFLNVADSDGKIVLDGDVTITTGNVVVTSAITIDLNSHNLTITNGCLAASGNEGKLTIEGSGEIKATNSLISTGIVILVQKNGSLELKGGTINANNMRAVQVQAGCKATIDGAAITGSGEGVVYVMGKGADVTLKRGTIASTGNTGTAVIIQGQDDEGDAKFTVDGGTIKAKHTAISINNKNGDSQNFASFTMNAGEITQDSGGSGPLVVLADAAAEIKGGTITGTAENSSTIQVGAKGSAESGREDGHSGKLTVSGTATIKATGEKGFAIYGDSYGEAEETPTEVIIQGGTIEGTEVGISINEKAKATINGGSIKGGETGVGALGESSINISGQDTKIEGRYGVTAYNKSNVKITDGTIKGTTAGLGTNGSDDTEVEMTVEGGTISGDTVGVYLPSGKLTVSGETTSIEGKAGIVVRGGTLDVKGGIITATGKDEVQIGDAGTMVQPAAIAVDKNPNYNSGKNSVTVSGEDTVVKSAEGQPTVSYSEQGVTKGKVPDGKDNTIKVDGGKFMSGTKPDKSVSSYTADNILIGDDGTPSDKLYVKAFGYGATKAEAIKGAMEATDKTEDDPWFSDWNDQTMWVVFNQQIPVGKFVIITVTDPLGGDNIQMLCNGGSTNFAWSYLNDKQTPSTGIVSGRYSIKAEVYEGTYDEGDEETPGVEVTVETDTLTVPAPATPDVHPAILGDGAAKQPTGNKTSVTPNKSTDVGDYFEVHFTTEGLQKTGQNGASVDEKYYLGFAVVAPEKATKFEYRIGADEEALLGKQWTSQSSLEKNVTTDGKEGVAYYVTVANDGTIANPWIQIRWQDANGTIRIDTYKIVIDEISLSVTDVTGFEFVDFGFKADPDDANKAINDASAEINPEAAKVTDAGTNTMYVAFKGKAASADQDIYAVFSNGENNSVTGSIKLNTTSKGGRMYFSFENSDQVGNATLTPGVYTVKLYAGDPSNGGTLLGTKSLAIYEVTYTKGDNVEGSAPAVYTDRAGLEAALKAHPKGFTFTNGASMWNANEYEIVEGKYSYEVKLNAYTYVAPPMPGTDPDNPDNPDNPPVVDPAKQFVDVPDVAANKWYRDALNYVLTEKPGVIEGTDGTHFSPNAKLTRAAFAKILWAIDGSEEPTTANPFTDVKSGDWFYKAVIWANAKGIMLGDAGRCKPEDNITREEMAVMIQRWLNKDGKAAAASKFTDAKDIHDWAADAVAWAAEEGYIKGKDDGSFAPLASLTRAEMIVVVARTLGWNG